jgi:hypothetical protein
MLKDAVLLERYLNPAASAASIARRLNSRKDVVQKILRKAQAEEFSHPTDAEPPPPEIELEGDVVIIGDVHAHFTFWPVVDKAIELGKRFNIRRLILGGDVLNIDALSRYPAIYKVDKFQREKLNAQELYRRLRTQFRKIDWILGNHDERASKATSGNIDLDELADMIAGPKRGGALRVTPYDRCTLQTKNGKWLIVHQDVYSQRKLNVAQDLSAKYECHVVTHHQHHIGVGISANGRYIIADNGCACTPAYYKTMRTNKMPEWNPGCAVIKDGHYLPYAHLHPFGIK